MSSTSSATPITTFSGLASGIDSSSVIAKLRTVAQKPIQQLVAQDNSLNASLQAWQSFNVTVSSLQASMTTLSLPTTYNAAVGTSSTPAVATISASSGATLGTHTLAVNQLAQTQKLISTDFTSNTSALSVAGSFTVNGKTVSIAASDALTDVVSKINASKAGVTAAIINVGPSDYKMTLTSNYSGAAGAISASDNGSGTVLNGLGLVVTGPATAIRQAISYTRGTTSFTGAGSLGLTSGSTAIGTALGLTTTAPAGSFQINGVAVAVDLSSDTLDTIADKINKASITGVTAQVVGVTDQNGNVTKQQLQIVNATTSPTPAAPPTFTDSNNVLATLGVTQGAYTNAPVTAAQDAKFNLDGVNFTRSTNTVGDVLAGASFTLLTAGTVPSPATTNLFITQNTDTTTNAVQAFVSAFNKVQDFVNQQNAFTPPIGSTTGIAAATPPLFGDSTLTSIQNQLNATLGIKTAGGTLEDIGITTGQTGDLVLDTGKLSTALAASSTTVQNLFSTSGTSSNTSAQFVSATTKTAASSGGGYSVSVSQAATVSTLTAAITQTGASTAPEQLTFSGIGIANPITIAIPTGSTLQNTVNQINGDGSLNTLLSASIDAVSGALKITSSQYGSGHNFQVTSDTPASATSSGLGPSSASSSGIDIQGTINGEPAGGTGQTLTGAVGNLHTEGLVVKYVGSSTGLVGNISITHGVADALNSAINQILDPINGSIVGATNNLNSEIKDTETQITDANNQVDAYVAYLTQMFSDMETRVSQIQQQGSAFAAAAGSLSNSSSSSTGH